MKIVCIQMDTEFCCPTENFRRASLLCEKAMEEKPDVIVLPETWNTGFFPLENHAELCDREGTRTRQQFSALAKRYHVNIIAGSVSDLRDGKLYNTAYVFDRTGTCIATYDKTHLFSPMGEDRVYAPGDHLCRFTLDGTSCAILICYDIRFPELSRALALPGLDMLFVVSQWPAARIGHLRTLAAARAIENQVFLVCCNGCGTAGATLYGGSSMILDPWGKVLAQAGEQEQLLSAQCDLGILPKLRSTIPVFQDRRPELY